MSNIIKFNDLQNIGIRVTDDSRYSVFDVIAFCGKKNPRQTWESLTNQFSEVVQKTDNYKFPASDRPIVQIDQTPYNPNAKPDTTCPACGMLSRAFEIERWGMCSFCWQKDKTTHRSPLELINAS